MEHFGAWSADNWFLLLQALGIIGSLLFTGFSIRQSTKARRVADLLTISEHHRALWSRVQEEPKLERISRKDIDLVANPVRREEEEFLDLVFVHFHTSWLIARDGSLLSLEALQKDTGNFFKLPIPSHVWNQTKSIRHEPFVRFVEESVASES